MSKARYKHLLTAKGVNAIPTYKVVEKDGELVRVSPNDKQEGVMHYRFEPKRKTFNFAK